MVGVGLAEDFKLREENGKQWKCYFLYEKQVSVMKIYQPFQRRMNTDQLGGLHANCWY